MRGLSHVWSAMLLSLSSIIFFFDLSSAWQAVALCSTNAVWSAFRFSTAFHRSLFAWVTTLVMRVLSSSGVMSSQER